MPHKRCFHWIKVSQNVSAFPSLDSKIVHSYIYPTMDELNPDEQTTPTNLTSQVSPTKKCKKLPFIIGITILVFAGGILLLNSRNNQVSQNQRSNTPTNMPQQEVTPPVSITKTTNSPLVNSVDYFYDEILHALTKELKDWDPNFIITDFDITAADTYKQAVESETQQNKYSYARITVFSKKLQVVRYYWYNYGYTRGLKQDRQDETQELLLQRVSNWHETMSKPHYPPGNAVKVYEEKKDGNVTYYLHGCHYYRSDVEPQKVYWDCQFIEENEAKTKEYLYQADSYESVIDAYTNQFQRWQKVNKISPVGGL